MSSGIAISERGCDGLVGPVSRTFPAEYHPAVAGDDVFEQWSAGDRYANSSGSLPSGCDPSGSPAFIKRCEISMASEHFDVLIVGAGLSGIGAGYHLQQKCPGKSYVILEGRDCIGGTWDLFRYPGIRSDSDMYTLGYSFKPWTEPKAIADGPRILNYVCETAADNGIDQKIRFNHRVKRASWSSETARWTVEAERGGQGEAPPEVVRFTCSFLFMCAGYYKYEGGYRPEFPGEHNFGGRIVHPQAWPDDL